MKRGGDNFKAPILKTTMEHLENTVKDPITFKYSGSIYSANKDGNQEGEYVDLHVAREMLKVHKIIQSMNLKISTQVKVDIDYLIDKNSGVW